MNRQKKRFWVWLAMTFAGGTLFQTTTTPLFYNPSQFTTRRGAYSGGCGEFYSNGVAASVDFCYLFDCDNGFFGGAVDPCDPLYPSLTDCDGYVPPDYFGDVTDITNTGTTSDTSSDFSDFFF